MLNLTNEVYLIPEIPESVKITGLGRKRLCTVNHEHHFSVNEEATLEKMMKAIHFDMHADVVNVCLTDQSDIPLSRIVQDIDVVISFGIEPRTLGFNIEFVKYETLQFDKMLLLVCDNIREINQNVQKKQLLWNRLQQLFLNH